jgi:hypothetical protein
MASTLRVALDGSQPYGSIQAAINDSSHADSVVVYPGRYLENVLFGGKNITLCSLEATTNDSSYIGSTIIDGNHSGSCVRFYHQEQGAVLRGFTLEHGRGFPFGAQNYYHGGGIFAYSGCNVALINCDIRNNIASLGGGLFAYKASLFLSGLRIHHNQTAAAGAGISLNGTTTSFPNITFDPINRCSIYENHGSKPCDLNVIDLRADLDIYLDLVTVPAPGDFYIGRHANFDQTQGYADTIHYQRAFREEINQDLYVSPTGDNELSGLSPAAAWRNIAKAINYIASDSLNPKTVHLLPGIYENTDQYLCPIPLKSHVNVIGGGPENTIFKFVNCIQGIPHPVISSYKVQDVNIGDFCITSDTNDEIRPVLLSTLSDNVTVSRLTIRDLSVSRQGSILINMTETISLNKIIVKNIIAVEVGGIQAIPWKRGSITDCEFSNIRSTIGSTETALFDFWFTESLKLQNCIFRDFYGARDQTVFHVSSYFFRADAPVDVNIDNCLFSNLQSLDEFAIHFMNGNVDRYRVTNCSFIDNSAIYAAISVMGDIEFRNNIFYNRSCDYEIVAVAHPHSVPVTNLYLDYNNIRGGAGGIHYSPYETNLNYGPNNISAPPMFSSLHHESPRYAQLAEGSPCINSATPDTTGLGLLPYDLAGNYRVWDGRIDMGCYEYDAISYVSVTDLFDVLPPSGLVLSTYPNPFAGQVNIRYNLEKASGVKLQVYNLRGQLLKTIISDRQSKGEQLAVWEGTDDAGRQLASGIYFLRTSIDGKPQRPQRLILAK